MCYVPAAEERERVTEAIEGAQSLATLACSAKELLVRCISLQVPRDEGYGNRGEGRIVKGVCTDEKTDKFPKKYTRIQCTVNVGIRRTMISF